MELLKSKTFWIAVLYLVKSVFTGLGIDVPVLTDIPDSVLFGAGAITIRQAISTNGAYAEASRAGSKAS